MGPIVGPSPRLAGSWLAATILAALLVDAAGCVRFGFELPAADDQQAPDGGRDAVGDGAGDHDADAATDQLLPDGPEPGGVHLWSRALGHAGTAGVYALAADSAGNVYITGNLRGRADLGGGELASAGHGDILVASYTASGDHRWSFRVGGAGNDWGAAITVDGSGNVALTGRFEQTVDLGGGALTSAGESDFFVASFDGADGAHRWSRAGGGNLADTGRSIAVDPSGNVTVAGRFAGTASFGGDDLTTAGENTFLASYAADGSHLWSRSFTCTNAETTADIAVDGDGNIFVAGEFQGALDLGGGALTALAGPEAFLASFGTDGAHRWSQHYGGTGFTQAHGVAVSGGGAVTIAGQFSGTASFGGTALTSAGSYDVFVASFDGAGSHQWSQRYGGGGNDSADAAVADADGNLTVTGAFSGSVSFGGAELTSAGELDVFLLRLDPGGGGHIWSLRFGDTGLDAGHRLARAPGGGVALLGQFKGQVDYGGGPLSSPCIAAPFLASFDASGAHRWSREFPGCQGSAGQGVALDASGNVFVAGWFPGVVDLGGGRLTSRGRDDTFVASYAADGNHRWSRSFGGASDVQATSIAVHASGVVAVGGHFQGSASFGDASMVDAKGRDAFIVSYGATAGAYLRGRRLGGDGWDAVWGLAFDADGNLYVAGTFGETIGLGGGELTAAGGADVFVASYDAATGAHRWSRALGGAASDTAAAVAVGPGGDVVVTGSFRGTASFGGESLTSAGETDVFLASYDAATGAHRWSLAFGAAGTDLGRSVTVSANGDVVVTGRFEHAVDPGGGVLVSAGDYDVFVASYALTGAHRWSRSFGGAGRDTGDGVAVDADGNVFVTGSFSGGAVDLGGGLLPNAGLADLFVASYTRDGAHRWSRGFGGVGAEGGLAVAVGAVAAITGTFDGRIDLGGGPLWGASAGLVAAFTP